jgi:hypothetical protein
MLTYVAPAGANSKWCYLRDREQILLASVALLRSAPLPLRFTVNLSPEVQAAFRRDPDGVRRAFRQTLSYHLGRDLQDVLYLLTFEEAWGHRNNHCCPVGVDGELGAHGGIAALNEQEIPRIEAALERWGGGPAPRRVQLKRSYNRGWSTYIAKNQGLPDGCGLKCHGWTLSHELGRLAKALHAECRGKNRRNFTAKPNLPEREKCPVSQAFVSVRPTAPRTRPVIYGNSTNTHTVLKPIQGKILNSLNGLYKPNSLSSPPVLPLYPRLE